jgi:phospholipid transport system substrate-binding protein
MAQHIGVRRVEPHRQDFKRLLMNRVAQIVSLALLLLAASLSPLMLRPANAQGAADPAAASVQTFYDGLTATMKLGGTAKGRYEKLKPVVEQTFDLPGMTALSVGASWTTIPDADQKALIAAFGRFTIATYARNFDSYSGEKFTVDPAVNQRGADKYVKSTMKPSGDAIAFNYRLHQVDGVWKIIDVYLAGNISTLAQKRSDFGSTLSSGGAQALVKKLNALSDQMLG